MILLIDNYDSFTWNLVQRLGEIRPGLEPGRGMLVVRNDEMTVEQAAALDGGRGPTHVLISPGPGSPDEAGVSAAMIREFGGKVPVLGVCLGHQCLAASNGMTVTRHAVQMHGKTSSIFHDGRGVFAGLSNPFTATRYHSLVVLAETIPSAPAGDGPTWQVSAWTDEAIEDGSTRRVVMGLRLSLGGTSRHAVEGVQFHPESFLTEEGPRLLRNFLESAPVHRA